MHLKKEVCQHWLERKTTQPTTEVTRIAETGCFYDEQADGIRNRI